MWELDHKIGWVLKKWCFWTMVFEKTLVSPLDSKEIKPVNPKGNQPWICIGRLMLRLKLHHFGHLIWRAASLEKSLMLGKTEGKRRRDKRKWDNWMASLTHWTWVWAKLGREWRTGKPGMLQSMGSQSRQDLLTEKQQQSSLWKMRFVYCNIRNNYRKQK